MPLICATEELSETMWAVVTDEGQDAVTRELGDTLGALIHFMVKEGYDPEKVFRRYLKKLDEDFPR